MKIDEFKAKLKPLAYTATDTRSGIISVYTHNYWGEDDANGWCFQLDPALKTVIVKKQWDKLDGMPVFCLRDLLNLITELGKTPVKERFPEKKYRLRWIDSNDGRDDEFIGPETYLGRSEDNGVLYWTTFQKFGAEIFTESELNQLKKDNPRLAPAIDAMKEPAEDKDE